ncbi:MAG: FecR domain-containing protein [Anaerolineae bacterium]|nr:FecR domain-containing protein [Anaerolineae bacterium]
MSLRPEGTIIRVGPNTIFTMQSLITQDNEPLTRIKLDFGKIWILLNGGSLEVETPSGVASVKGSLLGVSYDPDKEHMEAHCLEGYCTLGNNFGKVEFTDGQESEIKGDIGPSNIEAMVETEIQEWVNENPDAWRYFDGEEIPDWMPEPDPEGLEGHQDYFNNFTDYLECYNFDGLPEENPCNFIDGHIHDDSHDHDPICEFDSTTVDDHIHDDSHHDDSICEFDCLNDDGTDSSGSGT